MIHARNFLAFVAIALFCFAWAMVAYPLPFGLLMASSAACGLIAELIDYVLRKSRELDAVIAAALDDCGFGTTVYGKRAPVVSEVVHTPVPAVSIIEGGRRPVWPMGVAPE